MFGKKKKERNSTSYNLVFEDGAKHWFPYKEIPTVGTEMTFDSDSIKYNSELTGKYIVSKIVYEVSTTEQWTKYSNWIFIHVKRISEKVEH